MGQPRSILCGKDIHSDRMARRDEIPSYALSQQCVRGRQFHLPAGHRALVILRIHPKSGVGIHPLSLRDDTLDRKRPVDVVHRRNRVMCCQGKRKREDCSDRSDSSF